MPPWLIATAVVLSAVIGTLLTRRTRDARLLERGRGTTPQRHPGEGYISRPDSAAG